MIYNAQIETRLDGDRQVIEYLEFKGYRNCIDFGGVQRPWASKYVSTYVDLVKPEDWEKRYPGMYDNHPEIWDAKIIQADCDDPKIWEILGTYDFAISTHMLEHLSSPIQFLNQLPRVAHEGYIAVPNKIFELGRGREFSDEGLSRCGMIGYYRGAFPHRWIFTVRPDQYKRSILWAFPKLGAIEMMDFGFEDKLKHYEPVDYGQLGFMWEGEIPSRIVTDADIGFPDPQQAVEFYRKGLEGGL